MPSWDQAFNTQSFGEHSSPSYNTRGTDSEISTRHSSLGSCDPIQVGELCSVRWLCSFADTIHCKSVRCFFEFSVGSWGFDIQSSLNPGNRFGQSVASESEAVDGQVNEVGEPEPLAGGSACVSFLSSALWPEKEHGCREASRSSSAQALPGGC